MSATGIIATIDLLLSITDKLMDKLPDYSQRKRQQYYKLKKKYDREKSAEFPHRDDNLVDNLRDELIRFVDSFEKELK